VVWEFVLPFFFFLFFCITSTSIVFIVFTVFIVFIVILFREAQLVERPQVHAPVPPLVTHDYVHVAVSLHHSLSQIAIQHDLLESLVLPMERIVKVLLCLLLTGHIGQRFLHCLRKWDRIHLHFVIPRAHSLP